MNKGEGGVFILRGYVSDILSREGFGRCTILDLMMGNEDVLILGLFNLFVDVGRDSFPQRDGRRGVGPTHSLYRELMKDS